VAPGRQRTLAQTALRFALSLEGVSRPQMLDEGRALAHLQIGRQPAGFARPPREFEVLATLAEGMTNKAIARRLNISLHTVKFHVESLFRKLGARTRTEAVAKGFERRRFETITL